MAVVEKNVILSQKNKNDEVIMYPATMSDCIVDFDDKVPSVVDSIESPTIISPMSALELATDEMSDAAKNALLT